MEKENLSFIETMLMHLAIEVCKGFGLPFSGFFGAGRSAKAINARAVFAFVAKEKEFSLMDIGCFLERHHTTVKNSIDEKKMRKRILGDPLTRKVMESMNEMYFTVED